MAEYRSMYKCLILLALIACQMMLSAEGRQLKYKEKEIKTQRETGKEGSISFGDSATVYKDDFRPTTPGNSPGVGHKHAEDDHIPSTENTVARKKEILSPIRFGDSAAVYEDDFRPTTPGNSPGVGHKHAEDVEDVHIPGVEKTVVGKKNILPPISFGDSTAVYKDDFRPTTPGNSPGVGHKHAEVVHIPSAENTMVGKKEILPPISFSDSTTVNKNEFRPTTPGHSHSVAPSLSNKTAVYEDDFRPTTPGDSPGVGHKHAKDEEDVESKLLRRKHLSEVFKNEFQPPTLGHNPGVALGLSNKIAEPKA